MGPQLVRPMVFAQSRRLIAALSGGLILLGAAATFAEEPETPLDYPKARAAMRLQLEQANDVALQAQKEYFPEHYDALVTRLIELQRDDYSPQASLALAQVSQSHWARYNALVREASAKDLRELTQARRDIFALLAAEDDAQLCLAYEYRGTQALTSALNPQYQDAAGTYIAHFIEVAARARAAPHQWMDANSEDLDLLYATMRALETPPALMQALRPSAQAHPQFCEAMLAALDAASTLEGPPGARIWRFLVTSPIAKIETFR